MATVSTQKITTLGPIKMEVVHLTAATDADTFTTLIQNPKFAIGGEFGEANTNAMTLSISGRTVTLNQTGLSSDEAVVLVFGF